jgi:hypothetical protein
MHPFTFVAAAIAMLWLLTVLASPVTRFEQAVMSAFGLLLSPAALVMAASGKPFGFPLTLRPEDVVFVACLFGVAAAGYHLLLERHGSRLHGKRIHRRHLAHWLSHLMILLGSWVIIALTCRIVFATPVPGAFAIGGLLVGIFVIADRRDLLLRALLTGLLVSLLIFLVETLFAARLFVPTVPSLAGLPVEELLWAGVVGFAAGPVYEFARHLRAIS